MSNLCVEYTEWNIKFFWRSFWRVLFILAFRKHIQAPKIDLCIRELIWNHSAESNSIRSVKGARCQTSYHKSSYDSNNILSSTVEFIWNDVSHIISIWWKSSFQSQNKTGIFGSWFVVCFHSKISSLWISCLKSFWTRCLECNFIRKKLKHFEKINTVNRICFAKKWLILLMNFVN